MVGFVKLLLITLLLVLIGFCGWWYALTPQPPKAAARWAYMRDTLEFHTHNFQRLPDFKMKSTGSIPTENEVNFWLPVAQSGNRVAQIYVAQYLFAQGSNTNPMPYVRALEFLRPAADEGIPTAQNAVGVAYRYGLGVAQDSIEATKWFKLAAATGLKLAQENLYQMAHVLTEEDLAEAERRAQAVK